MERYLCSVFLYPLRNFSVFDAMLMTTDDEIPQFVIQFKDAVNNWFEEFVTFPNRTELVELLCLPNHPVLMKALCEKPGKLPGVLRFYLHPLFFDEAFHTVTRGELEFQQVFQNFLNAFGPHVFVEPAIHMQFSPGVHPALAKPKNHLKFALQAERHIAKEQIDTAHRVMEILTRPPLKHSIPLGLQISDHLHFCNGRITDVPPVHLMSNNTALLMYTKGFGRRRSLGQVCESIMSGAMDAGTQRKTSYFHQFEFLNACNAALILTKDENVKKWEGEVDDCYVIETKLDFNLLTFDVITSGTTVILSESALEFLGDLDTYTCDTVREIFARESSGVRHSRASLDSSKSMRYYVGSIGQRLLHAVVPLTFIHFRCLIVDQGLEAAVPRFSTEFTLYNAGYNTLLPLYPEEVPFLPNIPHAHRIVHDVNSGMIIRSSIPQTMVRKISFLPVAVQISAQERKFILRMQRIATTRSMINRFLDIKSILLGGEYNDISGCVFSLALPRLTSMTRESAAQNLKKHFSLLNGTLGQRLLSDFGVLDEEFASRSYVQENLKQTSACTVCFNEESQVLTLCGHSLCVECKNMLASENELLFKCPKCRSSLTHYDFIEFGDVEIQYEACSKFNAIDQTLDALFSKRRTKKRSLSKKALIIAPTKSIPTLKSQLLELNKYQVVSDWDSFNTLDSSNRVYITSFESFDREQVDDTLEGIVLACPSQKTDFYFDLMKACKSRSFPLPLHIFYAQGLEEITETIECLVKL